MSGPLEAAAIRIGTGVAKLVFRRWVGSTRPRDHIAVDQLLVREFPSLIERRRAQRQIDRLAEDVAERLRRFFEIEFGAIETNEIIAAADAVAGTLESGSLSYDSLLRHDLDPLALEASSRAADEEAAERALLSDAGTMLYDLALREACNYVVEVSMSLPEFSSRAAREMLRRETEILGLVREVLDRLPLSEPAGVRGATEAEQFEQQYRREVARKLDKLELFGLTAAGKSRRYGLSVAYISLAVSRLLHDASAPEATEAVSIQRVDAEDGSLGGPDERNSYLRVEEALARDRRHLIRGLAGSGKTTLLQWLAVQSARRGFDGSLAAWNETIPFFLPLRRYSDGPLPTPEEFPSQITATLAGAVPAGWVRLHLNDGRALVLIDGLDELPIKRRTAVREWLEDLCNAFPLSRYIVTTRPPAVIEGWLSGENFAEAELQPMTQRDVRMFIAQWHAAAKAETSETYDVAEDLDKLETTLAASVRTAPHLRLLATSPLMCAMLCALHRDLRSGLPRYRTDLYRIALETFLQRRDQAREVKTVLTQLDVSEKESIFQGIAWWLVVNNKTVIPREEVQTQVSDRLPKLPHVDVSAEQLTDELLLRSGLLREPTHGNIDFVHKTFQEYFAAGELADYRMTGLALRHATEAQWREVVVLAAGRARGAARDELLTGLLDRGDSEAESQVSLHLLAVQCLEVVPELSHEITDRVEAAVTHLLPPRSNEEARALAAAAHLVVPALPAFVDADEESSVASIRCLAHVGTEAAMSALRAWGREGRSAVVRVLLEAWARFDPERFARDVIADSPLFDGALTLHDSALIPPARHLRHLAELECDLPTLDAEAGIFSETRAVTALSARVVAGGTDLSWVGDQPNLARLVLQKAPNLQRLAFPRIQPKLIQIQVGRARHLRTLDRLADAAPALRALDIRGAVELAELRGLEGLRELEELCISDSQIGSVEALATASKLHTLCLDDSPRLVSLDPLADLAELAELSLAGCVRVADLLPLAGSTDLRILNLADCHELRDVQPLASLRQLGELSLRWCFQVSDVSALAGTKALRRLDLTGTVVSDIAPLANLPQLEVLALERTPVTSIAALDRAPRLRELSLRLCPNVSDLTPLGELEHLEDIDLVGASARIDLAPLRSLPNLHRLRVTQHALRDINNIAGIPQLRRVDLQGGAGNTSLLPLTQRGILVVPDAEDRADRPRSRSASPNGPIWMPPARTP